MRTAFLLLLAFHGLTHFIGFAKAFGFAELPQLTGSISRGMGVVWLMAGLGLLLTAGLLFVAPRWWWAVGLAAAVLSQLAVAGSWGDAKYGTVANGLVLAGCVYGFAALGPFSFRSEYEREVRTRHSAPMTPRVVMEADLAPLPEPVRRYLLAAGAVGQPAIRRFRAAWKGRIRGAADEPWMDFTAEQVNVVDEPARFFHLQASRGGLPVDGLHAFRDGHASMRFRLVSLFPLVDARGPEMDRAETVTLFNDIALLAPSALADPSVRWEALDDRSARGFYSVGAHTVGALFVFNDAGELVDFVSDDRLMVAPDGRSFTPLRWSTPVASFQSFGGRRVMARGEGHWHPEGGSFVYIELELVGYEVIG
jgi:hypothetical protein